MVLNAARYNQRYLNQLLTRRFAAADTAGFSDAIRESASKVIADVISFTESIAKSASKVMTDAISFTESLVRNASHVVTDTISFTESLAKSASHVVSETFSIIDSLLVHQVIPTVVAMFDVVSFIDTAKISGILNKITRLPQMILAKAGLQGGNRFVTPDTSSSKVQPFSFSKSGVRPKGV